MAEYLIQEETLIGIADAIREKIGSTESILASEMGSKLVNATYVVNTSSATASASDILIDKTAYVNGEKITGNMDAILLEETQIILPENKSWHVAYGNDMFVAFPESGQIAAYSTDGITWSTTTLPKWGYYKDIAYGNGTFVSVYYDTCIYSTDGITWNMTVLPIGCGQVVYGNGVFVAIKMTEYTTAAAYSTDGITWNTTNLPQCSSIETSYRFLAYGNGVFVEIENQHSATAAYSTDGITWNTTTLPQYDTWNLLVYGDGKFIAMSTSTAIASTDGITWSTITFPMKFDKITYQNDKFIAVNSTETFYSTDGITWNSTIMSTASQKLYSITYGNGMFVAAEYNNGILAYSKNGIVWSDTLKKLIKASSNTDVTNSTALEVEANLISDNIKVGQALFGVNGTFTSDATATSADLKQGATAYVNGQKITGASWAGSLTFSGTYATSTYYTAAGSFLSVDKDTGRAFITIQGGTSTSYENIYFTATSLPSGVTMLAQPDYTNYGTGGDTKCYYTAVLTGVTGKINVAVAMDSRAATSYDSVNCALTVTYA